MWKYILVNVYKWDIFNGVVRPFVGPRPQFQFLILKAVGRTPWTRDQPVVRPLPALKTAQTWHEHRRGRLGPTTPTLERAVSVHISVRHRHKLTTGATTPPASTEIGCECTIASSSAFSLCEHGSKSGNYKRHLQTFEVCVSRLQALEKLSLVSCYCQFGAAVFSFGRRNSCLTEIRW
jgi:hypothetical protein